MKRSQRLSSVTSYPFSRWGKNIEPARRRGLDIIRLDIGNPDLKPPDEVIEALFQSARHPERHGYPGYHGLPAFREAVAAYYQRRFGVSLDPETEVLPLIGSKEGIVNLALACLDPGDLVLVPDPGYAPYTIGAALAGAETRAFPLLPEEDFLPCLDSIPGAAADRAVMMWLNYPNNPTGATVDLAFFERAVRFAREHSLLLCHDAPYCDVTFDGYVAPSALQIPDAKEVAVEFNSLSKTWNMAGWRIGVAVGNADALAALDQLKSNVDTGIFRPLQDAAIQALSVDPAWIAARNEIYHERVEIVLAGFAAAGIQALRPRATLYIWAKVPTDDTSESFALRLLQETGVALAPGSFFGPGGEGYLRLSVTAPTTKIQEATDRIRRFVAP